MRHAHLHTANDPIAPELLLRAGIIHSMRRLLPLFLVLLLTLRGLLGDAMAMGSLPPAGVQDHVHARMAAPSNAHGAHHVAASAAGEHTVHPATDTPATHSSHGDGDHHHAGHAQDAAASCSADDADSTTGCDHAAGVPCSACGICHSAFSLQALCMPSAHAQPASRPASATERYASAQPQQLSKPPIS